MAPSEVVLEIGGLSGWEVLRPLKTSEEFSGSPRAQQLAGSLWGLTGLRNTENKPYQNLSNLFADREPSRVKGRGSPGD